MLLHTCIYAHTPPLPSTHTENGGKGIVKTILFNLLDLASVSPSLVIWLFDTFLDVKRRAYRVYLSVVCYSVAGSIFYLNFAGHLNY